MNIFITGASGFIGGAIVETLREEHRIVAMSRSPASDSVIKALGAHPVRCDLTTIAPKHLQHCDVVIHAAARAEEWGRYEWFYQANVVGTKTLLAAAKIAAVERFIHVGTEAALFYGQDMINVDETEPYALHSPYPYAKTKALAEQAVLMANAKKFTTLSLRPRMVWGPKDQSILPAILDMIAKKSFAWVDQGQYETSTTFVGNFCHAIELALTHGQGGEAYFITDKEISSIREFVTQLVSTQDVCIPDKSVPAWVLRCLAFCVEKLWVMLNKKTQPPISRIAAAFLSSECILNIDKARRELGYEPIYSTRQGLAMMKNKGSIARKPMEEFAV